MDEGSNNDDDVDFDSSTMAALLLLLMDANSNAGRFFRRFNRDESLSGSIAREDSNDSGETPPIADTASLGGRNSLRPLLLFLFALVLLGVVVVVVDIIPRIFAKLLFDKSSTPSPLVSSTLSPNSDEGIVSISSPPPPPPTDEVVDEDEELDSLVLVVLVPR